jgi:hypothetical protein
MAETAKHGRRALIRSFRDPTVAPAVAPTSSMRGITAMIILALRRSRAITG